MEDYMVRSVGKKGSTSGSDFINRMRLSEVGGLRTITEIVAEKGPKVTKLMNNLTNVIEVKKRRLEAMESKYIETRETIGKLLAENDKLNRLYCEEIKEMQFSIREHFQWICNDHEILSSKLERKQRELELLCIKLQKREAVNKNKRKKLAKVIKENAAINSLHENRKEKLADDHKREMEKLHQKIFYLEKQLNSKQALENADSLHEKRKEKLADDHKREMEKLHQKIFYLEKQLNSKQALEDLRRKLKENEEELEDLESFTQVVIVMERLNDDELQETCKELIKGLKELPQDAHIGVKRIGELNCKPFYDAAKRIYSKTIAEESFRFMFNVGRTSSRSQLASFQSNHHQWPITGAYLINMSMISIMEVIDEEDRKLKCLKRDLGDEVYKVVTTALIDISHYNPNTRIFKEELWNFSESRKATLKEGVSCFLKMCDRPTHEPKRTVIVYSRRNNRAT